MKVKVIGAGLAGCESAWQLAQRGVAVLLCEMKPSKFSPAHNSPQFAELVCSNSLRADGIHNAVGLLKEEMRQMNSLIMSCADATKVPAGGALAVDREGFSAMVTKKIKEHPLIQISEEEITAIDTEQETIVAAGPLASDALANEIAKLTGQEGLNFFDAAAPIVSFESINMERAFRAARYGKGGADYINCPMTKEEYLAFWHALIAAETAPVHGLIDKPKVFEGCMPVEVMAARGEDTMRFGPLKPVGLTDPHTDTRPYAVVQLRQDNAAGSMYNIVGFQTHLKFGEQKRVFSMIPGLEQADFVRYGVMHRNTFIDSPRLLQSDYSLRKRPGLFFAGQITGVEGYMESASSGILAGINAARRAEGKEPFSLPRETMMGALSCYISDESVSRFQPMGANFGILPGIEPHIRDKRERYAALSERSLQKIDQLLKEARA